MSRWKNESIEYCLICGKSYLVGCVKGIGKCEECEQRKFTHIFESAFTRTKKQRESQAKAEQITTEIMNFRVQ